MIGSKDLSLDESIKANEKFIDERYISSKCGQMFDDFAKNLKAEVEKRLYGFIEREIITREDSFKINRSFDSDKTDERYIISLEEQIKFLKEELKSKNKIIEILLTEKSQNSLTTYNTHTKSKTENFVIPKRVCKPPQNIMKDDYFHKNRFSSLIDEGTHRKDKIEQNSAEGDLNNDLNSISNNKNKFRNVTKRSKQKDKKEDMGCEKDITVIIGDSMLKDVKGWQLSKSAKESEMIIVKPFPGATSSDMTNYIIPTVQRKPNRIILHVGTNDLKSKKSSKEIAESIVKHAMFVSEHEITVIISGIIKRGDILKEKVGEVNKLLLELCQLHNIIFIDNENIDPQKHLNGSRLHLNRKGTSLLCKNFLRVFVD